MNFDETCVVLVICAMVSMIIGVILCAYEVFRIGAVFIMVGGITGIVTVFGNTFYNIWLVEKETKHENKT